MISKQTTLEYIYADNTPLVFSPHLKFSFSFQKDVSLLLLSVQFYFISLNQNHTAQHLGSETRQNIWHTLHQLLYAFLSYQDTNSSSSSSISTDLRSQDAVCLAVDIIADHAGSEKALLLDLDNKSQSSFNSQLNMSLIEQIKLTMGIIILSSETDELNFYSKKMISDLVSYIFFIFFGIFCYATIEIA